MSTGKIVQIIGPVVDVEFRAGAVTGDLQRLKIRRDNGEVITAEVAQHLGESTVRTVSMQPTDGLVRGMPVEDTGDPISVPVGREVLGRILNVVGEPVDGLGPCNAKQAISDPPPGADPGAAGAPAPKCSKRASR